MDCPRCGARMSGGICNECGFPMNAKRIDVRKKRVLKRIIF